MVTDTPICIPPEPSTYLKHGHTQQSAPRFYTMGVRLGPRRPYRLDDTWARLRLPISTTTQPPAQPVGILTHTTTTTSCTQPRRKHMPTRADRLALAGSVLAMTPPVECLEHSLRKAEATASQFLGQ
ncbi:hypothetical protein SARC_12293, partial [Sphaeroforma arctica JP610]